MKTDTRTLIAALRNLKIDVSVDSENYGLDIACIAEAADRLEELSTVEENRAIDGVLIRNPFIGIHPLPNDVLIDWNVLKELQAKAEATAVCYEGRPAVEGKPLELMTRDELLAYIRQREAGQPEEAVAEVVDCLSAALKARDMYASDYKTPKWIKRAKAAISAMGAGTELRAGLEGTAAGKGFNSPSPASSDQREMRLLNDDELKPIPTNLTGDLERAFNYGWSGAIEKLRPYLRSPEPYEVTQGKDRLWQNGKWYYPVPEPVARSESNE